MPRTLCYRLASIFLGALWSLSAAGGVILSPTGVTQNTLGTFSSISPNSIDFTHDGSGLPAFTSGVTDFGTYVATSPTHDVFANGNAWASADGVLSGVIDYDLGALYEIDGVALWNQDEAASQGIDSFDIFTSDNSLFVGAVNVGSFNASDASRLVQTFALAPSVGEFVRLQIHSNHGSTCCVTLGEIALDVSASTVPEPATLALLSLGLAGLGFSRRKQ